MSADTGCAVIILVAAASLLASFALAWSRRG